MSMECFDRNKSQVSGVGYPVRCVREDDRVCTRATRHDTYCGRVAPFVGISFVDNGIISCAGSAVDIHALRSIVKLQSVMCGREQASMQS
jgi:hypothetical protein